MKFVSASCSVDSVSSRAERLTLARASVAF
jgi:hypothetical protein